MPHQSNVVLTRLMQTSRIINWPQDTRLKITESSEIAHFLGNWAHLYCSTAMFAATEPSQSQRGFGSWQHEAMP
jgi:hypothetical protein